MIYITGANGWLGLNLIDLIVSDKTEKWGLERDDITAFVLPGTSKLELLKISETINIIEGDLLNNSDIYKFLNNSKDSYIFHTAGIIHPAKVNDFYAINRDGTKNLIEVAINKSIKRLIITSSNSPCGCNAQGELFDENSPYNPYMNYGISKMQMEKLANNFYNNNLIDISIIRPPWFYGPYQPNRQKLFFKMIKNGKVPIIGNGENLRSMVYTENLVQGMVLAATKKNASGKTYWIADETPYSMNEIIDTIELLLADKFNIKCNYGRIKLPGLVSDVSEKVDLMFQKVGYYNQKIHVLSEMNKNIACNISYAKKDLGYNPEYTIKEGMIKCLEEIYN